MRALLCLMAAGAVLGQTPPRAHSASSFVIHDSRTYLGVAVMELDKGRGVEVKFVDEDGPAAKAGIRIDDVVTEFNGHAVEGTTQFVRVVSETPPGTKVRVALMRAGAPLSVAVVLGRHDVSNFVIPPIPPIPPTVVMPDLPRPTMFWRNGVLGIETEALNSQLAEYFGVKAGVLVRSVNRQSAAERAGLKAGDVIVRASGKTVAETRDVTAMLKDHKTITLGIVRNHKEVNLEVNLDGS